MSSFASSQFSITAQRRAPTMPPTSAAKTISYAQSAGRPISFRRRAANSPATTKPRPIMSPKLCRVRGPSSISGCIALRLEVAHRVHRHAVDADLEVQVRAERVARVADVADDLAAADVGAGRRPVARLVRVA